MKPTPVLLRRALLLSVLGSVVSPAAAADLFTENFDAEVFARLEKLAGVGVAVSFVDYSSMNVGAVTHSIPEAPRMLAGSLPTRGALFKVDHTAAVAERLANLVALDDAGGSRLALSDNYRLKFDCYLRLSPSVVLNASGVPVETGTTEQMTWGVGYNATEPMGRFWRTGRGSGTWGWLTTEGGLGGTANNGDATLYNGPTQVALRNMDTVNAAADVSTYFTPAFGADASPVPHCPANQWVEADITVSAGTVTVEYKAVGQTKTKFFTNVPGPVAGTVIVGYEDSFSSASFAPDEQWMLLDNMVVEEVVPPTMTVIEGTPIPTFTGTPTTGTYNVTNMRIEGDLVISAVNFTGTGAPAFSVTNSLPIVIGPGATVPLEISFNPAAPNGIKSATITIVSDDPTTPSYEVGEVRVRRSAGGFLQAHYKLDETTGATAVDSSGNGVNGALNVRSGSPLVFGNPALQPGTAPGTAIGFSAAQSSVTGNYLTSSVVHTPSFSIAMWIQPQATGNARTLFQRDYNSLSPYDKIYALLLQPDGTLEWKVGSTTVIPGPSDPILPALADGAIHHIVLTHLDMDGFGNVTAARSRLYIDGMPVAEKTGPDAPGFGDYPANPVVSALHIGSRTIAGFGYTGDLDDIQIYGTELTREQVWEIYKGPGATATELWRVLSTSLTGEPPVFTLTFPSAPEGTYQLLRSPNLINWQMLGDPSAGAPDALTTSLVDPSPPAGNIYYRVQRN